MPWQMLWRLFLEGFYDTILAASYELDLRNWETVNRWMLSRLKTVGEGTSVFLVCINWCIFEPVESSWLIYCHWTAPTIVKRKSGIHINISSKGGVCVGNVCFSGSIMCTCRNARFEMLQGWGLVLSSTIWRKNSYLGLNSSDKCSLKDNNLVFLVNVNTVTALCKHKNKWVVGNKKK